MATYDFNKDRYELRREKKTRSYLKVFLDCNSLVHQYDVMKE